MDKSKAELLPQRAVYARVDSTLILAYGRPDGQGVTAGQGAAGASALRAMVRSLLIIGLLPLGPAAAQSRGTTPGHFEPPVARDTDPAADQVHVQLTAQEARIHLRNG
ncbi:hypothetical protein BH23ACT10_BH23ACT10_16180 [soil metagenome]